MSNIDWSRRQDTFFSGVSKVDGNKMMPIDLGPVDLLIGRVAESPVACGIHNDTRLTTVGDAVLSVLRGDENAASAHGVLARAESRRCS